MVSRCFGSLPLSPSFLRSCTTVSYTHLLPKDYARVLQSLKKVQSQGLSGDEAIMAAFEENVRDVARVGGG